MAVEFKISTNTGNLCTVQADRSWKVEDLKKAIEAKTQIHWLEQRLVRGKVSLDDDDQIPPDGPKDVVLVRRKKSVGVWLKKVKQDAAHLETLVDYRCVLPQIWADREFAEVAVKHKPSLVEYLSKELQPEFGRIPPPDPPPAPVPPHPTKAEAPPPKAKAQAKAGADGAAVPKAAKSQQAANTVPAKQSVQPPAPKPVGASPVPPVKPPAAPVPKQEQTGSSPAEGWQYVDPKGNVQGPFALDQIREWFAAGFLKPTLNMRCNPQDPFVPLQELFRDLPPFGDKYIVPMR